MNANEKALLLELCKFKCPNIERIKKLVSTGSITPSLLGNLIFNGVEGIAYEVLEKNGLAQSINHKFIESLAKSFTVNERIISDFTGVVNYLSEILNSFDLSYAFLGDTYMYKLYPNGCAVPRVFEILVRKEDVCKISTKLRLFGFRMEDNHGVGLNNRQNTLDDEKWVKNCKSLKFYKDIKLPYMKRLEVELIFAIRSSNGAIFDTNSMLLKSKTVCIKNTNIRTLEKSDAITCLCNRTYNNICDIRNVKQGIDMALYRFINLYVIFSEIIEEEALEIIKNAQKNDMIGELVFCINITSEILNIKFKTFTKYFETVGVDSTKKQLSYPINDYDSRKSYKYTETDMKKLLFSKNRYNLLVEDAGE